MGADSDSVCTGLAGRGDAAASGEWEAGEGDRFSLTDKLANICLSLLQDVIAVLIVAVVEVTFIPHGASQNKNVRDVTILTYKTSAWMCPDTGEIFFPFFCST